ncbi:Putative protein of unknown function [Podospora comata]|uniref:Uncharacterized protein n=1 Tax=Podospora comata TaxID=48703 RepID=A0ABY6SCQ0_PODCO|nr:Putative protein of unknown function [Podospora comata]
MGHSLIIYVSFILDDPGDVEKMTEVVTDLATDRSLTQHLNAKFGDALCTAIINQVLKSSLARSTTLLTEQGIHLIYKCSPVFQKLIHGIVKASLDKPIFGATAVKHVSTIFRSHAIANAGVWTVMSGWRLFKYWGRWNTWEETTKTIFKDGRAHGGDMFGWILGSVVMCAFGISAFPAAVGAFVFAFGGREIGKMFSDMIIGDGSSDGDDGEKAGDGGEKGS